MDSTTEGARKKVERALNSLVKNLGGWKAYRDDESPGQEAVESENK
jgi:hypothetical protein